MYKIDSDWTYDGTAVNGENAKRKPAEDTASRNGYRFALTNRTAKRGWDVDCKGTACVTYGLQVSKACPFDAYSDVNDVMRDVLGRRPVDLYTKEITMSDGGDGYEYGLRLYPHDGYKPFSANAAEAEDAIRKFMLDRGFVEIVPAPEKQPEIKIDLSGLKSVLDEIMAKAEKKPAARGKSLVSRLMKNQETV